MKHKLKATGVAIFILIFALVPSFSFAASINEILDQPDQFDEKNIEIEGEVIGEPLRGKDGQWINILSEDSNMGIFLSDPESLKSIEYWGNYKNKGDTVIVRGIFYKDCFLHQISDMHLNSLRVRERGFENQPKVSAEKAKMATILLIVCLSTAIIYFIRPGRCR